MSKKLMNHIDNFIEKTLPTVAGIAIIMGTIIYVAYENNQFQQQRPIKEQQEITPIKKNTDDPWKVNYAQNFTKQKNNYYI